MTLIFSVHYFLWYGALTSIFSYESVYARHYAKASPMQFGYLNMVLPLLRVIVTPLVCLLADRRKSHRSFFTLTLISSMISLCLYALLPLLMNVKWPTESSPLEPKQSLELMWGPWIYFCLTTLICNLSMGINTCLSDSFAVLQAEENGTSFGRVIVWGTFGWAVSALALAFINQIQALPRLVPGILLGALLLTIDIVTVAFWRRHSDFKLDHLPTSAAQILTGSTSPGHKEPSDYMPLNESAKINLGTEIDDDSKRRRRTKSPIEILTETNNVVNPFDSNIKTIDSHTEEAPLDSQPTSDVDRKDPYDSYSPNSDKCSRPLSITTSNEHEAVKKNEKLDVKRSGSCSASFRMQLKILGLILRRRRSLVRYLILFVLSGFFMSMHWNYFFLYLEQIYFKKFELISALSMVTQSLLGELPFFILSRKFIDFFGRSHTLSISLISIGVRFILYTYFLPNVNMYFIAVADAFQGPNYGLFYVVMTEVGLEYSFCDDDTVDKLAAMGDIDKQDKRQVNAVRLALRSTVQSLAFACYEGIGVALGSLVGGIIVANYGFELLWLCMAIGSIAAGLVNIIIEFSCREIDPEEMLSQESGRREFMDADQSQTLQRILSRPIPSKPAKYSPVKLSSMKSASMKLIEPKASKSESVKVVAPPVQANVSKPKGRR